MDKNRKKELIEEYKNRKPDMGVLSLTCTITNDVFMLTSNDMTATINSELFKLNSGLHGNRELQTLWHANGEDAFEWKIVELLDYQDQDVDYSDDLESLLELCLADHPAAKASYKRRKS